VEEVQEGGIGSATPARHAAVATLHYLHAIHRIVRNDVWELRLHKNRDVADCKVAAGALNERSAARRRGGQVRPMPRDQICALADELDWQAG
jgi:hypothetical protein